MNKRIQELSKQADDYAYKMNPQEDSYGRPANPRKFKQDRDAKFAELIVGECVVLAKAQYDATLPWGGVEQIKKHFGVEQ
jgi:hypothetical protein